jgi:hypothetical protein
MVLLGLAWALHEPVLAQNPAAPDTLPHRDSSPLAVVEMEHLSNSDAAPGFAFKRIPPVLTNDAAAAAQFVLIDGKKDPNSGELATLNDGQMPRAEDDPSRNFFFNSGTPGGRVRIDLGRVKNVDRITTYSWHPDTRAAQVYTLYAARVEADLTPFPRLGVDPVACGWTLVAHVDTRPRTGEVGGQYGVSIVAGNSRALAGVRYLLLDIVATEHDDDYGNTFFSEIDVVAHAE